NQALAGALPLLGRCGTLVAPCRPAHSIATRDYMTLSPLRRLAFGTLRRLMSLWVRSEAISPSPLDSALDSGHPLFYVLQQSSASDLVVLDSECRKAGLPRPVLPVQIGRGDAETGFFYLTPEPDWLGRQDKR